MPSVEVVHEPTPPPRGGKTKYELGCHIRYIEEKTGRCVGTRKTPAFLKNERLLRESRKY